MTPIHRGSGKICRAVSGAMKGWYTTKGLVIPLWQRYGAVPVLHSHELKSSVPLQMCRSLLHNYGLDMPSTQMLKCSQSDFYATTNGDPDSVAFIALSPSSDSGKIDADDHVSWEHPEVDDGEFYRNDGIWSLSFTKPANADLRFRRLLRDLHLTPLRVSDGTIGIGKTTSTSRKRTYKRMRADEVRPKWRLFTIVECDWQ